MRSGLPKASIYAMPWATLVFSLYAPPAFAEDTIQMPVSQVRLPTQIIDSVHPPIRFDTTLLQRTAGTENDVNRILATDLSSHGSGLLSDNSLTVRGGRADENIYILNGFEFPNLNHFSLGADGALGFASVAILKDLKMYAGAVPSEFASSAASAIVVETREGRADRFGSALDLSVTGGEAVIEGPVGRGSASFLSQVRYFDSRPVRDWITTGQIPRFMDGAMSLDLDHGSDSYSRVFGLYTWDRMSTQLPDYAYSRYDRSGRAGLSFVNYSRAGGMKLESGLSGLLSSKSSEWLPGSSASAGSVATSLSDEERIGRAFLKASFEVGATSSIQTGLDVKISNPDLKQEAVNSKIDTSLTDLRSGGFAEYAGLFGIYGVGLGLRAEYFSIYSSLGLSPQATVSRKFGEGCSLALDGSLRYVPQGELAEVAAKALFDDTHPPYELGTMALKRIWQLDAKFTFLSHGVEYVCTGYGKLYDREFKLVDGLHRSYYGGTDSRDGRTVLVFVDPSGKRIAQGIEAKAKGSLLHRLRFSLGLGFISITDEYLDGNFYRDEDDYGFSAKGIGYLSVTRNQLLSLSMIASQGRPIWDKSQILDQNYYSKRMPDVANLCARYTIDCKALGTTLTAYAEIDNLLNRTTSVYQDVYDDGTTHYLSLNGIFPLIGIQARL